MPLRLAVLSRGARLYSTRRLVEAARRRGYAARAVDFAEVGVVLDGRGGVDLSGAGIEGCNAALGRISPLYTPLGASVLAAVEAAGLACLPSAKALLGVRDKFRAHLTLGRAGVATPATAMVNDLRELPQVVERLGGYPLVAKPVTGTQGEYVLLVRDRAEAVAALRAAADERRGVLLQTYVAETGGADVRALVCGGRVVAAMTRTPAAGEFRSNLHRGGTPRATALSPAEAHLALGAAAALDLDFAGVDLLRTEGGPLVIEVNASPGLEGIETATGIDVAGALVDYLADRLRLPSPA